MANECTARDAVANERVAVEAAAGERAAREARAGEAAGTVSGAALLCQWLGRATSGDPVHCAARGTA